MNFTGIGLYTLKEAQRFTGVDARQASRWLFCRRFNRGTSAPLWTTQLSDAKRGGVRFIGFRDLLELRIINALAAQNIPLRAIGATIDRARNQFAIDYPLTSRRFLMEGQSIFYDALNELGDMRSISQACQPLIFELIVRPELYAGVEFSDSGLARRWFPNKYSRVIVLDPEIAFGKPILTRFGIRTEVVAASFAVEKSARRVAALFDLPVAQVAAAIRYEALAV